jgi:hypothetical protein
MNSTTVVIKNQTEGYSLKIVINIILVIKLNSFMPEALRHFWKMKMMANLVVYQPKKMMKTTMKEIKSNLQGIFFQKSIEASRYFI